MIPRRPRRRPSLVRLLALLLLLALPLEAQIPDRFSNLQVLPEDIGQRELVEIMRDFGRALGVRCLHCHVGPHADTLDDYDFATDEKESKRVAREMMKMVAVINGRLLPATGRDERVEVGCFTCHHGLEKPATLERELVAIAVDDGIDAAIARYRELRAAHFGSAAYDFRGEALNRVAEELLRRHLDLEGALAFVRLNLEFNPANTYSLILLAQGQARQGDRAGAIETLERARAVEPANKYVRTTLERLRSATEDGVEGGG